MNNQSSYKLSVIVLAGVQRHLLERYCFVMTEIKVIWGK